MSELRRFSRPPTNPIEPLGEPPRSVGLRGRLPYYAAGVVVVVLTLAWIDGGEEPIRPIIQPIETPGAN